MKTKTLIITTIICLAIALVAIAEVPQIIAYQGRLLDAIGDPVADGPYLIRFRIYDDPSAGSTFWDSGIRQLEAVDGNLSYNLGDTTAIPDNLFAKYANLWLGVQVGADPEMTPRTRLASVGHAYHALRSDSTDWSGITNIPAGFADGVDNIGTGDITAVNAGSGLSGGGSSGDVTLNIGTGSVTATHLADNSIGSSKIINNSITSADIANSTITTIDIAANSINQNLIVTSGVGTLEIQDGTVTSADIASNTITASNIASNTITASEIATSGVESSEIADGTIIDADISSAAAISVSKISGTAVNLSSTQIIMGDKQYGDSTIRINSNGINIGDDDAPSETFLLRTARRYNATGTRYGGYTTLQNTASGRLYGQYISLGFIADGGGRRYGVYADVDNDLASANHLYGGSFTAGHSTKTAGTTFGIYASGLGGAGSVSYGIFAAAFGLGANYAGYFAGNVHVTGTLSKSSGSFRIDHPLDPANKYLYHSFVESPDMMNIYNGNVVTDGNGDAIIVMPDYFDALNKDFRYQLTVIGVFAQAIISEELSGTQFAIRTDKPNVKVSWMVTGIRNDKYAAANRIQVEVDKDSREKGLYQHPEVYGLDPYEKSIIREQLIEERDAENERELASEQN